METRGVRSGTEFSELVQDKEFGRNQFSVFGLASNPLPLTASTRSLTCARLASCLTATSRLVKSTTTEVTPSTSFSADCTVVAHAIQVMPDTLSVD